MLRKVFLDTAFFIGLLNERDQHHEAAEAVSKRLDATPCDLYTSQMVLSEVLNGLADKGSHLRIAAVEYIDALSKTVLVVEQTPELFDRAYSLYKMHEDKEWGMVDCSSLVIMQDEQIYEAATTDRHLKQMGRRILMPQDQ